MAKNTGRNTDNLIPWKKGDPSPNPNGRPKGRKNFKTLYYEAIEKIAKTEGITGEEFEVKMIEQAVRKGFNGDRSFYTDTMDRVHSKAQQHIDHTSEGKELPQPLLYNVLSNNSSTEDSGTDKKD